MAQSSLQSEPVSKPAGTIRLRRVTRLVALREHVLVMSQGERLCVLSAIRQRPSARRVQPAPPGRRESGPP
jgi:hypothetical protein